MKKLSIFLFVGAFIIPAFSLASIDINLKYGAQGIEVKELQEFLIGKGFLTGQATGNFFTLTKKAVIAYQNSVGLPATGFVGPMTREKINPELIVDTLAEVQETGTVVPPQKNDVATALQNQINALLAQIKELNAKVQTQTVVQQQTQTTLEQTQTTLQQTQQSVQQIQQNTTPISVVTPAPVPTPAPVVPSVPEIDKSEMLIKLGDATGELYAGQTLELDMNSNHNSLNFSVFVLNKQGNYRKDVLIKMDAPDNAYNAKAHKEKYPDTISSKVVENWSAGFVYVATSTGNKTITFTAENLSKTISVVVR